MRKLWMIICVLILTVPLTGCWDRREVSELALVMAKAVDLADDGSIRVSVQVAIPSKVGGSQSGSGKGEGGKSFYIVSATGRTVSEADMHIQQRLPRQLYLPHLRIILVGDKLARSGMEKILDHFGRNPPNRLRSTILIAKDSDALPFLQTTYPLESLSGEAIRKLEKELTGTNTTLLDFMIQSSMEGTDQTASAISLKSDPSPEEGKGSPGEGKTFEFRDTAIFRDLKLVGYVSGPESVAVQWLNQRLRYVTVTVPVPKTGGTISVEITQPRSRSRLFVRGSNVAASYELSGAALLTENTTGLDADSPTAIRMFQGALNSYIEKEIQQCLSTLNTTMNADATGIGRMFYHQHPYAWQKTKTQWRKVLPTVRIVVHSKVKVIEGGKSGPPLYGKPQHGIKQSGAASKVEIGGSDH